jgi:hypothetical protein
LGDVRRAIVRGDFIMAFRYLALLLASAPLASCAAYPDLVGAAPIVHAKPSATPELDAILDTATQLQGSYARNYKKVAVWSDISQLPIIGAAGTAAWILLDDKTNAATIAGKIGIGAGTYAAARGQFLSAGLPDAYIAGHGALTCVLSEGSYFSGVSAEARYQRLLGALSDMADQLQDTNAAKNAALGADNPDDANLKTAVSLADQAITQALTAQTEALKQQAAYDNAAPVFRNAVASISVRVASKGRVRPDVDFASLRDSLTAAAQPPSGAAAQGLASNKASDVALGIATKTQGLVQITALLTAATFPYAQHLDSATACVDLVK